MKKKIKVSQWLIYVLLVLGSLSAISVPIHHIYIKYTIYLGVFLIICCLCKDIFDEEYGNIILYTALFFTLNLLFSIWNRNAGIGAAINILIFIYLHMLLKLDGINIKFIQYLSILYAFECVYCAYVSRGYGALHYASIMSGDNSYINPNIMAYMVCVMSFQVWAIINSYSFKYRFIATLFNMGLLLLNIWSISNLDCRSSYLAILFFLILVYFYPSRLIKKNMIMIIYIALIICSVLVPVLYIYMYKNAIYIDTIGGISKRTYTGREVIWNSFTNNFVDIKDWIVGLGSQTEIQGTTDMHNMTLSLIKNGGIISVFLVFGYLGKQISCCFKTGVSRKKFAYLAAVLSSLIIGFFESIFLSPQFFCIIALLLYQADALEK